MVYTFTNGGELTGFCETESECVVRWREEGLILAGWSVGFARTVAHRTDIDLHDACRLLDRGCDERTAWRILR